MKKGIKHMAVASALKQLVAQSGLTQIELAQKLGIAQSVLSRQLQGRESIPLDRIKRIAELLSKSDDETATQIEFVLNPIGCSIDDREKADSDVVDFYDRYALKSLGGKPNPSPEDMKDLKDSWKSYSSMMKKRRLEYDELVQLLARFVQWAIANQSEAMMFLDKLDDDYFKSEKVPEWASPEATLDTFVFSVPLLSSAKHKAFYDELKELRRKQKDGSK